LDVDADGATSAQSHLSGRAGFGGFTTSNTLGTPFR
jgi:hypothetical protein